MTAEGSRILDKFLLKVGARDPLTFPPSGTPQKQETAQGIIKLSQVYL